MRYDASVRGKSESVRFAETLRATAMEVRAPTDQITFFLKFVPRMGKWIQFCLGGVLMSMASLPPCARAQKVESDKEGNLIFTDAAGKPVKLNSGGKSSQPSLDPGKRRIVYVRGTTGKMISTALGDEEATELCLMDVDGRNLTSLLHGKNSDDMTKVLAGFEHPQFSPDGRTIYFLSSAWVTSGAVHACHLATKKESFVCAGNVFEVVPNGEYAGDLLVAQHRYFLGGGSYDWYWLMKPDGKEVGVVGETTDMFKETYLKSGK